MAARQNMVDDRNGGKMTSRATVVGALALAAMLGLGACAADVAAPAPESDKSDASTESVPEAPAASALDADGFAIPGEVLQLEVGDSVTYYSMPTLQKEDAQKVTINSVEYVDKADVADGAPLEKIEEGVLVVHLTWESVKGSVQSNNSYIKADLDSGEKGVPYLFYRSDKMKNGGVEADAPKTGTYSMAISRGATTITIEDYLTEPVAQFRVDTSA